MLVWVRKLLENWVARVFFGLLIAVFVFWGISNVVSLVGSSTSVAQVAGKPVDVAQVQAAYQSALNQAEQSAQGEPSLAARQHMAQVALAGALRQAVLNHEEQRLGVVAPPAAIRQEIDGISAFQVGGVFNKAQFAQVLQQNNSTPDAFIGEVRDNIASREMLGAVLAGVSAPDELVNQVFAFLAQQRFAETVDIQFKAQPNPAPPAAPILQRYWRNHPAMFTAPETRTIKLVILSPALLAPQEHVAAADIEAGIDRQVAANPSTPQRSVQVLMVGNLAASSRLEAAWKNHAKWARMQAMAKNFDATSLVLKDAQQTQIPTPTLGQAVFAATPGQVVGPIAGPAGMFVFKVTKVSATGPDAATLRAQVTQQLQLQMAQAQVAQNVNGLQDALAGQTPLDQLPTNLGLVALQGTLDAKGDKPDGKPAPLPGGAALRAAIVKTAFATAPGDPPALQNGPDGSYYALEVDQVVPAAVQPYGKVQAAVLSDWTKDQVTREAEVKAADLMEAVNRGQTLDAAAGAAGFGTTMTPGFTRGAPPAGMTPQMASILFSLKSGQATMLQNATGFSVAVVAKVIDPTPAQAPQQATQVRQAMDKAMQNDVGESFLAGLEARDSVTVDQKLLAQVYQ